MWEINRASSNEIRFQIQLEMGHVLLNTRLTCLAQALLVYFWLLSIANSINTTAPFDFSPYPPIDRLAPVQPSWDTFYNISTANPRLADITIKTPYNSATTYPTCPNTPDPATGSWSCDWSCWNCTRPQDVLSCANPNNWALTYDDGPSNNTIPILDALAKTNSKATFCVIGSRVTEHPEILQRIYNEGHTICAHTWSHHYLTTLNNSQIVAEFQWVIQAIEYVVGVRPLYARPPFGDMDDRVRYVFQQMSLTPLTWNRDCYDWMSSDPTNGYDTAWIGGNFTAWIAQDAKRQAGVGLMSLEHDLFWQTAQAALVVIPKVVAAGFNIINMQQCNGIFPYVRTGISILAVKSAAVSTCPFCLLLSVVAVATLTLYFI